MIRVDSRNFRRIGFPADYCTKVYNRVKDRSYQLKSWQNVPKPLITLVLSSNSRIVRVQLMIVERP